MKAMLLDRPAMKEAPRRADISAEPGTGEILVKVGAMGCAIRTYTLPKAIYPCQCCQWFRAIKLLDEWKKRGRMRIAFGHRIEWE
jgi:hypothetical protein